MALEDSSNIVQLIKDIGQIGAWIQTIGLVIILWIIFEVIILINNRIKRKQLYKIEDRLVKIEHKINQLIAKKR